MDSDEEYFSAQVQDEEYSDDDDGEKFEAESACDGSTDADDDHASNLSSNLMKLSKYKPKLHRDEIRKMKSKEKRIRRKEARVSFNLIIIFY